MHFDSGWDMNSPKEHGDLSTRSRRYLHLPTVSLSLSFSLCLHIGHCYVKRRPYWTWDELDRDRRWALVVGTGKRGQVEGERRRQVAWSGARRLPQGAGAREKGTSRPSSLQDACSQRSQQGSEVSLQPRMAPGLFSLSPIFGRCFSLLYVATHLPTRATAAGWKPGTLFP